MQLFISFSTESANFSSEKVFVFKNFINFVLIIFFNLLVAGMGFEPMRPFGPVAYETQELTTTLPCDFKFVYFYK